MEACWWVQRHMRQRQRQRQPTSRGSVDDRRHRLWCEGLLVVDPDGVDQVGAQVPRLNKLVGVHTADEQVQRLHTAEQGGGHRVSRQLQKCRALQAGQVSSHALGPEEASLLSAADKGSWAAGLQQLRTQGPGVEGTSDGVPTQTLVVKVAGCRPGSTGSYGLGFMLTRSLSPAQLAQTLAKWLVLQAAAVRQRRLGRQGQPQCVLCLQACQESAE